MKIRNDISTVQVLHELRQNHTVLAKQQEKLATGLKIVAKAEPYGARKAAGKARDGAEDRRGGR